jgi:ribose 5-phosphate isomerase B
LRPGHRARRAGIGSCKAANKIRNSAAMCYDLKTIINSKEHNNANVLSLGGPFTNRKNSSK